MRRAMLRSSTTSTVTVTSGMEGFEGVTPTLRTVANTRVGYNDRAREGCTVILLTSGGPFPFEEAGASTRRGRQPVDQAPPKGRRSVVRLVHTPANSQEYVQDAQADRRMGKTQNGQPICAARPLGTLLVRLTLLLATSAWCIAQGVARQPASGLAATLASQNLARRAGGSP